MSRSKTINFATMVFAGLMAMSLSGCVGGTTYGTGVTQEKQLLQDLEGMISFGAAKKKKVRIDYTARPDLIIPNQTAILQEPLEQEASTSNVDWPESPEQRLARIRGEAEKADPRSGEISVAEARRKKVGIKTVRSKIVYPDIDRVAHAAIDSLRDGSYRQPSMLKKEVAYTARKRKYLTEPPDEYRLPANSAPIGDLGISEAEKDRRVEKAARIKRQNSTGMWTDN